MPITAKCRVCAGVVEEFFDFGRQPLADAFIRPGDDANEFFYRLAVGICGTCTMVQLMEEVPRQRMFHEDYPYVSSGSSVMREHFQLTAKEFLRDELTGADPFIVEIGSNDGVMLKTVADEGVRHIGVEPSGGVADMAASKGVRIRKDFFEETTALDIAGADGKADVIFSANTFSHIAYVDSVFRGIKELLAPTGVFVFEDPYFSDIVERTSFDQIYDEHFYFFTVRSVQAMAARHGLELVDVQRLPVHGGEVRYSLAHPGARRVTQAVAQLLAEEDDRRLTDRSTLQGFGTKVNGIRDRLVPLLTGLRDAGKRVVGYGATAKSSTLINYCGIGPDLISFVCDTTVAKQGLLTPGSHIPVRSPEYFADPYPDYAVLFAWNHAKEIMAKEQQFRDAGGRWILYVPVVHVV